MNAYIIDEIHPIQMQNLIHFSFPNDKAVFAASGNPSIEQNWRWLVAGGRENHWKNSKNRSKFISMRKATIFSQQI